MGTAVENTPLKIEKILDLLLQMIPELNLKLNGYKFPIRDS